MTDCKFAWHFSVIVGHLFGSAKCAEGRVADVSKKFVS